MKYPPANSETDPVQPEQHRIPVQVSPAEDAGSPEVQNDSGRKSRTTSRTQTLTTVDWTASGVILAGIRNNTGNREVLDSVFCPWPQGFDPFDNPEATGDFLQQAQQQCSWTVRNVAVSLPRQFVSLRMFRFPPVADHQLAGLISLQMESRQNNSEAVSVWDVLLHPEASEEQRVVSVIATPDRIVSRISAACKHAGWKCQLLTSADVLLQRHSNDPGEITLSVQVNRAKLEVTAFRSGIPVSSIAGSSAVTQTPEGLGALTLAMIHRVVASLPDEWNAATRTAAVSICGSRSQELIQCGALSDFNVIPGATDERTPRANALASELRRRDRANLLQPQRAIRGQRFWHRTSVRLSIVAVLAAMVAAFLFVDYYLQLQQQLTTARQRVQATQSLLERGAPVLTRHERLQQWNTEVLNPSEELAALLQLLPESDQMLVSRLTLENLSESGSRAIRLEGQARSIDEIHQLNRRIMASSERYRFQPQGIGPAPSGSELPVLFRLETRISAATDANDSEQDARNSAVRGTENP